MPGYAFLGLLFCIVSISATAAREEPTIDQLKAQVSTVKVSDKVHLCVEIADRQLTDASRLYESGEVDRARSLLADVVSFSELARDYSIQANKHQKQTEIAVRAMTRKLNDILHAVGLEDQPPVRDAIAHLEHVRDDLLKSMFPKGAQ